MRISTFTAAALAAVAPFALCAAPAAAQVTSVATINPVVAIANSKAFLAANNAISAQYKAQLDQVTAKETARQALVTQLIKQFDKNGDQQLDQAEQKAAADAKSPLIAQIQTVDREQADLQRPAILAQAFAVQNILDKYDDAQTKVLTDRKVGMLVSPSAVTFATDAAVLTDEVTAQLDATLPTVSTTPPANYRPDEGVIQLQQQLQQYQQALAIRAAQAQQGARPAANTPAAGAPAATTPPAKKKER